MWKLNEYIHTYIYIYIYTTYIICVNIAIVNDICMHPNSTSSYLNELNLLVCRLQGAWVVVAYRELPVWGGETQEGFYSPSSLLFLLLSQRADCFPCHFQFQSFFHSLLPSSTPSPSPPPPSCHWGQSEGGRRSQWPPSSLGHQISLLGDLGFHQSHQRWDLKRVSSTFHSLVIQVSCRKNPFLQQVWSLKIIRQIIYNQRFHICIIAGWTF